MMVMMVMVMLVMMFLFFTDCLVLSQALGLAIHTPIFSTKQREMLSHPHLREGEAKAPGGEAMPPLPAPTPCSPEALPSLARPTCHLCDSVGLVTPPAKTQPPPGRACLWSEPESSLGSTCWPSGHVVRGRLGQSWAGRWLQSPRCHHGLRLRRVGPQEASLVPSPLSSR